MPTYIAPIEDMMFLFEKLRNNKNYNEIKKYEEVTPESKNQALKSLDIAYSKGIINKKFRDRNKSKISNL